MDVGINLSAAEENHDFIIEKLRAALAEGALEEQVAPSDNPGLKGPDSKEALAVSPSDSGYGSNASFSPRGSVSSISVANQAFEEELRRQRTDWQPESLAGLMANGSGAASSSLPKVRRRTGPVGLVKKWFVNEKAIIQAASDGDAERVAELISLGVDVNARDRWG